MCACREMAWQSIDESANASRIVVQDVLDRKEGANRMTSTLARRNGDGSTNPVRSDLFSPVRDLFGFDPFAPLRASWAFDFDVTCTERGYEIDIPVAGYASHDIDVTYRDGVVTVMGKNDRRNFTRSLTVPEDVDPEKIGAHVQNGMLTLMLDRRPEAQPKKIEVKHRV